MSKCQGVSLFHFADKNLPQHKHMKYKIKDLGFQVRNRHKIWWMAGYFIAGRLVYQGLGQGLGSDFLS